MTITFTNIQWRNNNDKDIFNLNALKSISLEGLDSGIVTIKGESGVFKAPYCGLTLIGGVSHFELTTKHPSKIGEYIYIAIFDGNPMEVFTKTLYTIIDGEIVYNLKKNK